MRFAIIGVGGYIAPRHVKAIKETGNELVAALDPHDSVGFLDSYFPNCEFFTQYERFDRYLDKMKRRGEPIDYVVICSPNYLHDAHIRSALRNGCNVICEKPVVLEPHNIFALKDIEKETGKKVNVILQRRLHPDLIALKKKIKERNEFHNVHIKFYAPRGKWYDISWKGKQELSGGIVTNIGIHIFDLMYWFFGHPKIKSTLILDKHNVSGTINFDNADVRWNLSTSGKEQERLFKIDGEEVDFTSGNDYLHTKSYEEILAGRGFTLDDALPSLRMVYNMRGEK